MSEIAIFPSALGVRAGVLDAATRLRAAGHQARIVDVYDGRTFDDYAAGSAFAEDLGFPELMRRATAGAEGLADDAIVLGFSNGAAMATHVAVSRPVGGAVLVSGALPLAALGAARWPRGVPAQIHQATDDPFRRQDAIDALAQDIRAADASVEVFDYPGAAHLFTDPSLPAEFDPDNAEVLWRRVLAFCP